MLRSTGALQNCRGSATARLRIRQIGNASDVRSAAAHGDPLFAVGDPTDHDFLDLAGRVINSMHGNDFSFEQFDELVQEEPTEALDAERAA